ncbi:MAG: YbgA family protein, partial [Cognaticolwellia sp.]
MENLSMENQHSETSNNNNKISIGISSCLLGHKVRFDSGHKQNSYINNTLSEYFDFIPFCPEVDIGLGVPREAIRLVLIDEQVHCVGAKTPELDVTQALKDSAKQQASWQQHLSGYILKKDSPSCGMERVRLYKGNMPDRVGVGIFAQALMDKFPHLPVEEEGRLGDAILRENFIQRVFIYARWQKMLAQPFSMQALMHFHAQHKYIFMSHDQNLAKALGRRLGQPDKENDAELLNDYLQDMMVILKIRASRKNHVNTLQHIQGYLKNSISADDKAELVDIITQYRDGLLPLIVPITLLRHHFRRFPNDYITDSYYMKPHPKELMLLNSL